MPIPTPIKNRVFKCRSGGDQSRVIHISDVNGQEESSSVPGILPLCDAPQEDFRWKGYPRFSDRKAVFWYFPIPPIDGCGF